MAEILKGAPVTAALNEKMAAKAAALKKQGVIPTLAILRVGERPDDLSYERGAAKRCAAVGVNVRNVVLPEDVGQADFDRALEELNEDDSVHGILLFRPLPAQLDNERARQMLSPEKDVDGCTDGSLAGVFTNTKNGFPPCTAQAAMEILDYYGIDCTGKRAAVIGRSLVVGRPAALMLMHRNATVTVCHTKTQDMPSVTREVDILIVCAGRMETIGAQYLREGQVVIDVGIGWNEEKGKLCGDVKFEEAEPLVAAVTPVPGGVGTVTTSVLVSHVVEAAARKAGC
ncbi:MAG: bifunctional 5,10-methylenetetrahydrofolate dehydrogenase/5,10-methenyltetrahydrofolate cyclohydrolase [Firmicutes bacterium]|nr:bifunctional 5,10-methylenetetrahydrofolate dehydrogenase/5,10-methenyltetrahydrofolate cyclohydrolase [Bacillota bacterium]MDD7602553.1 bifunctional 5,10-methylenetetrahydrofolate dehydrogenase/5,10-methenyltetrahydrofolate cyclohydrolase [Bacillota bacterium]MDY5856816.1 bifunctional 5,10-methylenetetrahydrofolate dehydrogenase/5,10-methenyltetrahydrofolate cyclohydrolase [Anaerovoracaceae bacterium]